MSNWTKVIKAEEFNIYETDDENLKYWYERGKEDYKFGKKEDFSDISDAPEWKKDKEMIMKVYNQGYKDAEDNKDFKPFYIIEYNKHYLFNKDCEPAHTENEIAKYDTYEEALNNIESKTNTYVYDNFDFYHITNKQFYNKILKQYGIK